MSPSASGHDMVSTFAALADETRWGILIQLGAEELSASALAARLPISRQAIAKHLVALAEAGLIVATPSGREIRYRAIGSRLNEVAARLDSIGSKWDARLAAIARTARTAEAL